MKTCCIKKSQLSGSVIIPSSKSQTLRGLLFASLAKGKSTLFHCLSSPDTTAMIYACRLFGAIVKEFPDRIEVQGTDGNVAATEDVIHAGNSGIVLRFCTAVGALGHHPVVITGDHSIRHFRPMKSLISSLNQLGARVESMRGDFFAPIIIKGPLKGGKATLSGEDSQPVSALLIACAFAERPSEIIVHDPGEIPWVNLTLKWLNRLQIPYEREEAYCYRLQGKAHISGFSYSVPGDWSSAAFPLAAALITHSELTLENVDRDDEQGDKALVDVLMKMGAQLSFEPEKRCLHVLKSPKLQGITLDVNEIIDALPILAVVACFAEGETHLVNASNARHKESDRLHTMTMELRKMGGDIEEKEDGLLIRGSVLQGTTVESHNDHRVALSLMVAALAAEGETTILNIDCIEKSYPDFIKSISEGPKKDLFSAY